MTVRMVTISSLGTPSAPNPAKSLWMVAGKSGLLMILPLSTRAHTILETVTLHSLPLPAVVWTSIGPFTQEDSEHCACWLRSAEARSSSALADAPIIGSAVLRPCASGRSYGRSIARSARPKNLRLQILSALNMGVWALLCSANPLGLSRTHGPEHALLRFAAEGFLHFSPHARFSTHNCEIFLVA